MVEPECLSLDPSYKVTEAIFKQILDLWEENAKNVKSLIGDKIYDPFTK